MSGKLRKSRLKQRDVLEDLMSALITNRNFQKLWQDEILDVIKQNEDDDDERDDIADKEQHQYLSLDSAEASMIIDNLGQSIHLAIETFLRSCKLFYFI